MMQRTLFTLALLAAFAARADRLVGTAVLVSPDGSVSPTGTVATTSEVADIAADTDAVRTVSTNIQQRAESCADKVRLYSTNYVVTSTVYVQSIGGVPYDPSNQVVRLHALAVTDTNVQVTVTVKQIPLVTPTLDWRATLGTSGVWSNMTASASQIAVPEGVTNAAAAYLYTFPRPSQSALFLRAVDNSTGASGSGLWWIVFGGITVDGRRGLSGSVTNVVGSVTNVHTFVGGILAEPDPLGGE